MVQEDARKFLLKTLERRDKVSQWNRYKAEHEFTVDISKVELGDTDLREFNFTECKMAAADLSNADLSGADFSRADLSYANMKRANLANSFLTNAVMKVANLRGVNAVDANFDMADLSHAKLNGAWLVGCSMGGANLEGADLRGANLKFANMLNANLTGANVEDADLSNVELTEQQISGLRHFDRAIISGGGPAGAKKKNKSKMKVEESYDDLFTEEDCYKILEISADSELDQIEKAYRRKAKEYHPDRVHHLGEKLRIVAEREFERIQNAYKSLSRHKAKPAFSMDNLAGTDFIKQKSPDQLQIDDYILLIKENPQNDKLHYNLGLLYFKKGLVDLAIDEYQKAIMANPYNIYAEHNLKVAKLLKVLSGEKNDPSGK